MNDLLHLAYLKIFINLLKSKNVGEKQFLSRDLDYINTDVYCLGCTMLQPFLEAFSNGVGEIYRQIGATIYIDDILIYIYIDDILIYGKNF